MGLSMRLRFYFCLRTVPFFKGDLTSSYSYCCTTYRYVLKSHLQVASQIQSPSKFIRFFCVLMLVNINDGLGMLFPSDVPGFF